MYVEASMLDNINEQILRLLGEDARQSSAVLARKLGVSAATVRRRVNRLAKTEVLRVSGVVDPVKLGFHFIVIIAFDVQHGKVRAAMQLLAGRPEVKFVSSTTGRFDVIVIAWFPSAEGLSDFMRVHVASIEGLRNAEIFVCLRTGKRLPFPF